MTTPWETPDLAGAPTGQLLELYASTLAELRGRNVLRTNNPPAGDYAEWLVARALDGTLMDNSVKSFDVESETYGRIQVKACVVSQPPRRGQLQTSPFRSDGFEYAALVQFSHIDYTIVAGTLVPADVIKASWTWRGHVNGHVLRMTPALMAASEANASIIDVTALLRDAALGA